MLENESKMEIFKDIKGYPGYQISNLGRVWSKKRQIYLKTHKNNSGYFQVCLYAINGKSKKELVHRLVALAFIPNLNNYPCVNHKDENKENNSASNLEWCDRSYNVNYGSRNEKAGKKIGKPIKCIETGIIYNSGVEAAKALGTTPDIISKVLHNKSRCKTANGFHIEFAVKEE